MSKIRKASLGLFIVMVVGLMILPQQIYAGSGDRYSTRGVWTKVKFGPFGCQPANRYCINPKFKP